MTVDLLTLTASCGTLLHLAVVPGKAPPVILMFLGKAKPTGKVMTIEQGDVIEYVDTQSALHALHDNGWTVLGSGFVPK